MGHDKGVLLVSLLCCGPTCRFGGKQKFVYHEDTKNVKANDRGCFEHTSTGEPRVATCVLGKREQMWEWIPLSPQFQPE